MAAVAGSIFVVLTSLLGGSLEPTLLLFVGWTWLPYGLLLLMPRGLHDAWAVAGAGPAMIATEARAPAASPPRGRR